ncbi:TetR/AcrR family transcriptional regulator [Paenibacillus sp. y28]|uniref:TetR/AcrR family transcriptional regulator n=1 Tax=Paenibacillus sp. y28 TaxID=3129110 RepID=UPI0030181F3E
MKENQSRDRRIVRTRSMICDAFLVILNKKTYDEISIVDIADQANINRSTFYAHFIDKEDLLQKMIAEQIDMLKESIRGVTDSTRFAPSFTTPDPVFLTLFEHASRHDPFYRVMLLRTSAGVFRSQLNEVIREGFFVRLSRLDLEQKLQVPLDILLDYVSFSTSGIMVKWLSDNKVYSPHHMALQLTRMALIGVYSSMGASGQA